MALEEQDRQLGIIWLDMSVVDMNFIAKFVFYPAYMRTA